MVTTYTTSRKRGVLSEACGFETCVRTKNLMRALGKFKENSLLALGLFSWIFLGTGFLNAIIRIRALQA